MARPSDQPFDSDELLEKRREQREFLRSVPDFMVAEMMEALDPPDAPAVAEKMAARLIESRLRELADEELADVRQETRDRFLRHLCAVVAIDWVDRCTLGGDLDSIGQDLRGPTAVDQIHRFDRGEQEKIEWASIAWAIVLLRWADELAGNYADPRFQTAMQ